MSNLTVVPEQSPLERIEKLSLMALVDQRREVEHMIAESGGELTDITEDLFDNVNALLAGKVDKVAVFVKKVIPAHIEACKKQIKNLEWLEDRIKEYAIDCVEKAGGPLQGLAWRARTQNNPPSIVIENPDQIPQLFKKATVVIRLKFDPSDANVMGFWKEHIVALKATYPTLEGDIIVECDNAALREAMLDKKDKKGEVVEAGMKVEGARVEQGKHVRFEEGRAKATTPKKSKTVKEIEQ
jgi:hypothetical protein